MNCDKYYHPHGYTAEHSLNKSDLSSAERKTKNWEGGKYDTPSFVEEIYIQRDEMKNEIQYLKTPQSVDDYELNLRKENKMVDFTIIATEVLITSPSRLISLTKRRMRHDRAISRAMFT